MHILPRYAEIEDAKPRPPGLKMAHIYILSQHKSEMNYINEQNAAALSVSGFYFCFVYIYSPTIEVMAPHS